MTTPVFISGMHIDDDGNLVINADELDAAGVKSVEFIEQPATDAEAIAHARAAIRADAEAFTAEAGSGEAAQTITQEQFRLQFSRAVAEDDEPLFAGDDGELTNEGLDNLTNIAEASAEPLFDRIRELEVQVERQTNRADSYARTAQACLRDAGPALVEARERAESAEAQLADSHEYITALESRIAELEVELAEAHRNAKKKEVE